MPFIDFRFRQRKGANPFKLKVYAEEDDLLLHTVKSALNQLIKKEECDHDDADTAFKFVKMVSCCASELDDLLSHPKSTIDKLNSSDTPILTKGIDVLLPPKEVPEQLLTNTGKKAKHSSSDVLMGRVVLNQAYLKFEHKSREGKQSKDPQIDEQILEDLYTYYEEIELGWRDERQEKLLRKNAQTIKNALCFCQKHWDVLLRAKFLKIPSTVDGFESSKLLQLVANTTRNIC